MEADFAKDAVLVVTLLMFVASAVAAAVKRVRLPYTVALVVTGSLLAMLGRRAAAEEWIQSDVLSHVELEPGVVLYVLLPLLLFEAAFNLDSRRLFKNIVPILVLAVPAVIISTAIVGGVLYLWGDVPHSDALIAALLFGAMVSTTDAVAVVAIFREIGAPKQLTVLVEGEALFNSGTALVLFIVIAKILLGDGGEAPSALEILGGGLRDFVVMALGGIAVGVVIGYACAMLIGRVDEDPLIEITLSTICAPGAFLAGSYLGVSDVMAVIGAGLTLGNFGRTKISPSSLEPLSHYWHYLAFVANSLIFLLVGFSLHANELLAHAAVIPVAIVAVLVARAVGIFPVIGLVNRFSPPGKRIDGQFQAIMWWGGIRGALVLVMALTLSQFDPVVEARLRESSAAPEVMLAGLAQWASFKSWALHLAFGIVFFTILVNATSTSPFMRLLGMGSYTPSERYEEKGSLLLAKRDVRERLARLKAEGVVPPDIYALLIDRYVLWEGRLRKELADLRQGEAFSVEDERRTLLSHCLGGEKAHLLELFYRGDIREDVTKDLCIALDDQIDLLHLGQDPDEEELERLGASRMYQRFVRWVTRALGETRFASRLRVRILNREFEAARARLASIGEATSQIERVRRAEGASDVSIGKILEFYDRQREAVRSRLQSLVDVFPKYAAIVQEALSERYCLRSEEAIFRGLAARGRMSPKVLKDVIDGLREEMAQVGAHAKPDSLIQPADLVRHISFFQDLSEEEVDELARVLRPIAYVEGEVVVRQGDSGDRMFLIARGSVEVVVDEDGSERVLDTLGDGDFFGEIALLTSSPRTATVRTKTASALLELRRRDLKRVTESFPHVREVLEAAYRQRVLSTSLARVSLFAELSAEERATLVKSFRLQRYEDAQPIVSKGAVAQSLLFVKHGEVRLESDGDTRTLTEGDTHGEEALCSPAPTEDSCVAVGDVELLVLRHFDLIVLLERDEALKAKVLPRIKSVRRRTGKFVAAALRDELDQPVE